MALDNGIVIVVLEVYDFPKSEENGSGEKGH